MQYKSEGGGTLTKCYKHEIYFSRKRKGNIYISCACANACLSLFAEESRGCDVLEKQTEQNICRARGPTDKNNYIAITK